MWRTRVGYAGGTTPDPTYRSIGDHTECFQVDFDPERLPYEDLLEVFWTSHSPSSHPRSTQYKAMVLAHDDVQEAAALRSLELQRTRLPAPVHTEVRRLERFYVAEDYHDKYALKHDRALLAELRAYYPEAIALRDSTAAARLNGYVYGLGSRTQLEAEIERFGLSTRGEERLRSLVEARQGGL